MSGAGLEQSEDMVQLRLCLLHQSGHLLLHSVYLPLQRAHPLLQDPCPVVDNDDISEVVDARGIQRASQGSVLIGALPLVTGPDLLLMLKLSRITPHPIKRKY